MKELDYLKDMLCKELSKITQQNDFTTSTLETSFKIVDMLKDIEEIKEKEGMQSYDKDGSYGYWGVGYGGRMPYADGYGGGRYSYGNGNMKVIHPNELVQEVFEVTGYLNIMDIEC